MTYHHVDYFEPPTLKMLGQVYQACIKATQNSTSSDATRELMADRIMSKASNGETDPLRLVTEIVRGFRNPP
jgi:hypothetical protein